VRANCAVVFSPLSLQPLTRRPALHTRYRRALPQDNRAILQRAEDVLCLRTPLAIAGAPAPQRSQPSEDQKAARAEVSRVRVERSRSARALLPSRHPRKRIQRRRHVLAFALCLRRCAKNSGLTLVIASENGLGFGQPLVASSFSKS